MNTRRLSRSRQVQITPPPPARMPDSVVTYLSHPAFRPSREISPSERKPGTIQELQSMIEGNVPFTFVKRGDGEDLCMLDGQTGQNCDGASYTPALADGLRRAFSFLRLHGAYIVSFADYPLPFITLLHQKGNDIQALKDFYRAVRNSPHSKVYVGPERAREVAQLLKADFVSVPMPNADEKYDSILEDLKSKIVDGGIYMFSAGFCAKILIADALLYNPRITCLDIGSSFDSLVVGSTRWNTATESSQLSQEEMKTLYADFR